MTEPVTALIYAARVLLNQAAARCADPLHGATVAALAQKVFELEKAARFEPNAEKRA